MPCDMCDKEVGDSQLFYAMVEGTRLRVCKSCSKFGKVLKQVREPIAKQFRQQQEFTPKKVDETEEMIVGDYANKVKSARESKGLKQEELAQKISEKESVIHNVESGHMEPDIKLAHKLEHFLGIKLVEEVELAGDISSKPESTSESLTVGDIIKVRKRKT